jgi:hypothetical protein
MNIRRGEHWFYDRRKVSDTKWAEIVPALLTISYGLQAIQPGTSQWRVLLSVYGSTFVWGSVMIFVGALSVMLAYSNYYKCRFFAALVQMVVWGAVVVLFARVELAGPPFYNGVILMAVAVRVMFGAVRHEKQIRDHI